LIARVYPFVPVSPTKRKYTEEQLTALFVRDGFIDRYSGARLVFPGVLRLLSQLLPGEFPFHPNWKASATHPAFWELFPTLDHIVPVTRGVAPDLDPSNWVTTSQLRNSAKANWTLEELGWSLFPPGDIAAWDGLLRWFFAYTREHPEVLNGAYVRRWHRAALVHAPTPDVRAERCSFDCSRGEPLG
jgi:hypothetical protein